jgi:transposase
MNTDKRRWALALVFCAFAHAAPQPADWVPARWPWSDVASLALLEGSPVNCLLLRDPAPEFVAAATGRRLVTLAVLKPGGDPARALAAKVTGLVLEGDFSDVEAAAIRAAAGASPVVELTSRARLKLGDGAPIVGTHQGVWPGIGVHDDGVKKAGPTGSIWIDTNTGFIRAARAFGGGTLWLGNEPPPRTLVTTDRYLQVIADAAISGARWIVALDSDFAARIPKREAGALNAWRRMNEMLAYFERHPEWRAMREFGRLAVVQDPAAGSLLSGGILDMIAVKHTPVRPIPGRNLTAEALKGATMAVNVDPESLTPEQKEVLRAFTRAGNTMLSGPPGWKKPSGQGIRLELEKDELQRLNDMWRDVNNMIGRRNLGVRLFNVSSMLSNALESADGNTVVLHLVNYADFPVENVTAHFLGSYRTATLLTPDGVEKKLEIYRADEAQGVDIAKVATCATIKLEK